MTGRTRTVHTAAPRDIRNHLPEFRSALEQQRQFRVDQLRELGLESACSTTAADEPRIQVAAAVRTAAEAALADIDAALQRLKNGSYGTCEQCETAIPLERLEMQPMSRLCIHCQHAAETRQPATTRRAADATPHQARRSRGSGNGRARVKHDWTQPNERVRRRGRNLG
jgi:RNA polymerase-binding protein DksA